MGPITGFRIVNLRVRDNQSGPESRDKVAYPDLTVDLDTGGHVVIGLENGGGKGTLLGFLFHVFAPADRQFLPRLAQRRQRKQGDERRIEQYIPGGSPTHVVVEVAIPARGRAGARGPSKVLLGACLSKPAGAGPAEPAEEFFWSARCVADTLDLQTLAIRSGGRLLDHKEWELWLNRMKIAHPDAEIFTETRHKNWERHLSDTLMIDIEFVTSWLLLMNQDEGAADRVFTYGSSREFLNTLVTAVANPERIKEFHNALIKLSEDADQVEVKRGRKRLLDNLLISSEKMARHVQELHRLDAGRRGLFDALLATKITLETLTSGSDLQYESAYQSVLTAAQALTEAEESCTIAQLHETQARSQLAALHLSECTRSLQRRKGDLETIKRQVRITEAAERLADLRTEQAEAQSIEGMFTAKLQEMEPVRLAASSAAQVWKQRVQDELEDIGTQREQQQHRVTSGQELEDAAHIRKGKAESTLGGCHTRLQRIEQDLDLIVQRIADAVARGDLGEGQNIAKTLADTITTAEELHRRSQQESERSQENQQALDALSEEQRELDTRAARSRSGLDSAIKHHQSRVQRGEALTETLIASNLLELDTIDLLEHATMIEELLGHTKHSARTRQLKAALDAASVARTVAALETGHGLPPRPDIETLCEQATSAKLGARSGWSYLTRLPSHIAERYAHHHPDLAAGIVVNIPEDLAEVTELVEGNREYLTGPVVIGPPEAFHNPAESSATRVVLPESGFWSIPAAQSQLARKQHEHELHQQSSQVESDRYDLAVNLQANLIQWSQEAGPAVLEEAEHAINELTETVNKIAEEEAEFTARREQLLSDRDHADARARELNGQHSMVKAKEQRLEALMQICSTEPDLVMETSTVEQEIQEAQTMSQEADRDIYNARGEQREANERLIALKERNAELTRELGEVSDIHDRFVRPEDDIEPLDENADSASLKKRANTAAGKWNGSVTDEQLKIKLNVIREKVQDGRESLTRTFFDVLPDSERFIADNPALTARDISARRTELNSEWEKANQDVGKLEQERLEKKRTVEAVSDELKRAGRSHGTPREYVSDDIARASEIAHALKELRDDAVESRERALISRNAADAVQRQIKARKALIGKYDSDLSSLLIQLSTAVSPLEEIDEQDRRFDIDTATALNEGPENLRELLSILDDPPDDLIPEDRVDQVLTSISDELNSQKRLLTRTAKNTVLAVNVTEAELRNADETVIVGDILLHTLRALPRDELISHAVDHHRNIEAKLTVVADEVARFDKNLNALSKIAFATVQNLLRSVHQAIKDSELPTTPAMGRWSGLPLLRIGGLDTLTKDQKEAAVLSKLQDWFTPDQRGPRPAFDAKATVNALIEAVTPRVKATVLIPSDPLDAQHKPVEQLAMTSGGEGVTVALILASLLASRRSLNHGHRYTTMFLDNPFSKVTKPMFLRLARDVASSLGVRLVLLTGIRDLSALTVFPSLIQLRVSQRANANVVLPADIADDRLHDLLHEGTLYVSAIEKRTATGEGDTQWPTMSSVEVHWDDQLEIDLSTATDDEHGTGHE